MAEDLTIITGTKAEIYQSLIPQIKGLLEGEPDLIANLANIRTIQLAMGWFLFSKTLLRYHDSYRDGGQE